MTIRPCAALLLATALAVPTLARAQGTLSTQGFGYPTSGMSTRALGTGGGMTEFDPLSSTNPAALPSLGGGALYVQGEPEFRQLTVGAGTESARIARHPLTVLAFPLRQNVMAGLALSNFLDRSFETNERRIETVGGETLPTTNFFKSDGAIADVRLAVAWSPASWLRLGVGGHAITGDNRLRSTQRFDDSLRFAPIADTSTVTYVGTAISAGASVFIHNAIGLAASFRKGGAMSVKHSDTTLANANVPDRMSFSAAYVGIRGTTIAARTSKESWTRMQGLGSPAVPIYDGWDTSVGADVLGPRWGQRAIQVRAGARTRTLPFGLPNSAVKENSASLGLGTLFARGRIALDVTGIRALRTPVSSATDLRESAWTISAGLTVRP
ncbi:MAG: hypothetical protein DMD35_04410 [Gemmatimonadetes bacterium]|nr:MAG: hypothetical protein DMD35_04410 [Gemmatimonadota bacterium]